MFVPNAGVRLAFVAAPVCRVCGFGLQAEGAGEGPDGDTCGACMVSPPRFDRARAMLAYDDRKPPIIIAYKRASRVGGDTFADPVATGCGSGFDRRRRLDRTNAAALATACSGRRYNQSAELARRMAGSETISYAPDLLHRNTGDPQPGRA